MLRALIAVSLLSACAPDDALLSASPPPAVPGAPDLHVPYVVRGQTVTVVVDELAPGGIVHLAAGVRLGRGPCLAGFGGVCLGIVGPRLLASGVAGPDGVARVPVTAPINLAYQDAAFQAISDTPNGWMASQALLRPVLDDFPPEVLVQTPIPPGFFPLEANSATVEGNALFANVSYGGGCATHDFAVVWDGQVMESFPVQIPLTLYHNGHNDPCDAWLTEDLVFDLGSIIPHWGYGEPEIAQINIPGGGGMWEF